MSRSDQQVARLLQELVRLARSGRLSLRWLWLLGVAVVAYLLLQPVLERSLGIDLPGLADVSVVTSETDSRASHSTELPNEGDIENILSSQSRATYQSPAGLRYTRSSQHGHRLKHLLAHATDQPDRPGQHGVFDSDDAVEVVGLVDEAFRQALAVIATRVDFEAEQTVYTVNCGSRIGYLGGESGKRRGHPAASYLRLVIEENRLITAFPCVL